jgi:hypothetical protein
MNQPYNRKTGFVMERGQNIWVTCLPDRLSEIPASKRLETQVGISKQTVFPGAKV